MNLRKRVACNLRYSGIAHFAKDNISADCDLSCMPIPQAKAAETKDISSRLSAAEADLASLRLKENELKVDILLQSRRNP